MIRRVMAAMALFATGWAATARAQGAKPAGQAQNPEVRAQLQGHSTHGEAFNEGPRQRAYLMGGTGSVHFPVTTRSRQAQRFFDQGVGQVHGFWYFEAERSFRQVNALDPECAMAYWGMAMANTLNEGRAKKFIAEAVKRRAQASPRETMWIDALAKYYEDDKRVQSARKADYAKSLEAIMKAYPNDVEPKAFYALQLWENGVQKKEEREKVYKLLQEALAVNPMHPCHHYVVHLWNGSDDARALKSAALAGPSAPGIAHMWHMPGHTYSSLKRYADAVWQQEASARVDHAQMMRDHVMPDQIHNYAHNNQWLISDLIYVGRVHDAIDLAKNMIELPRHPKYNNLKGGGGSAAFGIDRLYDTLMRYELWDDLISLSNSVYLRPADVESQQLRWRHALGIAWFSKGDSAQGAAQAAAIESLAGKWKEDEKKAAADAQAEAKKAGKNAEQTKSAVEDATRWLKNDLRNAEHALQELRGYQDLARGDVRAAAAVFEKVKGFETSYGSPSYTAGPASRLVKERLSRIWLRMGDREKAEKAAVEAANQGKNEAPALANLVDVLARCGKMKEAREKFAELRPLCAYADLSAPVFQRIAPIARQVVDSADWRPQPELAKDLGPRPPLDSLGPFRWQPTPAAPWSLRDSTGKRIALKDYRGRPVVVFFFLGRGCVHCMEQLNAFAPVQKDFARAGIDMVAVSADTVAGLKATFVKSGQASDYPFPLVSDSGLKTFKAYRCYDDFEKMPLHGTFLIDADGLVRWQDISFEPFKEPRFLLDEAKRLLRQDPPAATQPAHRISAAR